MLMSHRMLYSHPPPSMGVPSHAHVAQNAVQPSPLPGGSPPCLGVLGQGGGSQASCMRQKLGTFGHCGGTQGTGWDPMGPSCLAPETFKWVVHRMTHWG